MDADVFAAARRKVSNPFVTAKGHRADAPRRDQTVAIIEYVSFPAAFLFRSARPLLHFPHRSDDIFGLSRRVRSWARVENPIRQRETDRKSMSRRSCANRRRVDFHFHRGQRAVVVGTGATGSSGFVSRSIVAQGRPMPRFRPESSESFDSFDTFLRQRERLLFAREKSAWRLINTADCRYACDIRLINACCSINTCSQSTRRDGVRGACAGKIKSRHRLYYPFLPLSFR